MFAFPATSTLNELLNQVDFTVGLNLKFFIHLRECLLKLADKERICSISFDEMAIRENIKFNFKTGSFEGLEDTGYTRVDKVANYALVFMVQGVTKPWKQPLAFYF